jgi:mRNA interferase MazF
MYQQKTKDKDNAMVYGNAFCPERVRQFSVYVTDPGDPIGYEMNKPRPYIVVSQTNMNNQLGTVIVVPMTCTNKPYVSRVFCSFQGKEVYAVLDQIMRVDKSRLLKRIGCVDTDTGREILRRLKDMFDDGINS